MFERPGPPESGPVVWIDLTADRRADRRPLTLGTGHPSVTWNRTFPRHEQPVRQPIRQPIRPAIRPAIREDAAIVGVLTRPLAWLGARLIAPPGDDLRRWNSTDVTCRVKRSATEAIEALGRTDAIEWGDRRRNRLSITSIRHDRSALGGPLLADAVVRGHRTGDIALTIAIFEGNSDTCFVQLRRVGRSAWGVRRRRRCMAATHDAADRLVEQIVAVDFRPPTHDSSTGPIEGGFP